MKYDVYTTNADNTCRFTLGKQGVRTLLVIGLNPSVATNEKADTTITKVGKVAEQNGYDGFVMLNLYPVRSTDYRLLPQLVDRHAYKENINAIGQIVKAQTSPAIWAAWGQGITNKSYFARSCSELVADLAQHHVKWLQFGQLTAEGHPRHPSRIHYNWEFQPFNAAKYVAELS